MIKCNQCQKGRFIQALHITYRGSKIIRSQHFGKSKITWFIIDHL